MLTEEKIENFITDLYHTELDPLNLTIDETTTLIANEVRRAKAKHPGNFCNPHHGYAVLLEEVDELWDEVKKNSKTFDILKAKEEAIQIAAMAVRFVTEL